jgi:hypothetical protein
MLANLLLTLGGVTVVATVARGIYVLTDEPAPAIAQMESAPQPAGFIPPAPAQWQEATFAPPPVRDVAPAPVVAPELHTGRLQSIELDLNLPQSFDWHQFADINLYPAVLLLGIPGSRKTTLVRRILTLLGGSAISIDPHNRAGKWGALKVYGGGRNYGAVTSAINAVYSEMGRRYTLYDSGVGSFSRWEVVIDELPSIAQNCPKTVLDTIASLLMEARKVNIRVWVLSQGDQVSLLGLEGKSSLKRTYTWIRMRGFVKDNSDPYPVEVDGQKADWDSLPMVPLEHELVAPGAAVQAASAGAVQAAAVLPGAAPETTVLEARTSAALPSTESAPGYGPEGLSAEEMRDRALMLRANGMGICQTIETLWGCTKGSNSAYQNAREEYRFLLGE